MKRLYTLSAFSVLLLLTVQGDLHTSHSPMLHNLPNVQTNCIHHMDNSHFTVHHCLLWTFFSQTSQIIRSTACADVLNFCVREVRWKHLPFTGTDKIFRGSFATIYKFNFFVAGRIHLKLTAEAWLTSRILSEYSPLKQFVCSCEIFLLLNLSGQDPTSLTIKSVLFYTYQFTNNLLCKAESPKFKMCSKTPGCLTSGKCHI